MRQNYGPLKKENIHTHMCIFVFRGLGLENKFAYMGHNLHIPGHKFAYVWHKFACYVRKSLFPNKVT